MAVLAVCILGVAWFWESFGLAVTLGLAGVLLQVTGLLVAMHGVRSTYLALRDTGVHWSRLRRMLRRVSASTRGMASTLLDSAAKASAPDSPSPIRRLEPNRPIEEQKLALVEWINYLDQRARSTVVMHSTLNRSTEGLRSDLGKTEDSLRDALDHLQTGLVGPGGAGLKEAGIGLAASAVGTVLSVIALPW